MTHILIIPLTVHVYAFDKQLDVVISTGNKPIENVLIILSKEKYNYTTMYKKIISIVECLRKFRGILFFYEINV